MPSAIQGVNADHCHEHAMPSEADRMPKARWPRRLGRAASMPQALDRQAKMATEDVLLVQTLLLKFMCPHNKFAQRQKS